MRVLGVWASLVIALVLFGVSAAAAQAGPARAVFFSSPTCPYCAIVAERDLAPLATQHGEDLELLRVDSTTEAGEALLAELWTAHRMPPNRRGVPTVLIGDVVLVGAGEIPERLPALVDAHLAEGGIDWPELEGLAAYLAEHPPERIESTSADWRARLQADLPGNYVALGLLIAMLLLGIALLPSVGWQRRLSARTPLGVKEGVALAGLGMALYLAWGETSGEALVCGPVGQCNIVQQSSMAMLFGFLPTAVLGVLGYLALLGTYGLRRWGRGRALELAPLLSLAVSAVGFAFSILLTFWQPFMIGATCAWCLGSAVSMSLSCLFNTGAGREALTVARGRGDADHSQATRRKV